jgi:hypothetical protein
MLPKYNDRVNITHPGSLNSVVNCVYRLK